MLSTLENLIKLARERKSLPLEGSYTNKLLTDKVLSKAKVLEEVDELIEAIEKDTNKIHEAADVFYHLLMYLEANGITADYFHDLSEAWGFILSLQYTDWFSNSDANTMLQELDAGNGFWDRTATELDAMAAQILAVTGSLN